MSSFDTDLYGDLEEKGQISELQEMTEKYEAEKAANESLRKDNANLIAQLEELMREKKLLETNISCLYETAVIEIGRKDKEIASLSMAKSAR